MEAERVCTVEEAALLCDVSDDTIRRRLHRGLLPRARRQSGAWRIPVGDLVSAGFKPRMSQVQREAVSRARATAGDPNQLELSADDARVLAAELARVRARCAAAEALASARADHIADLRWQLGMEVGQLSLFRAREVAR